MFITSIFGTVCEFVCVRLNNFGNIHTSIYSALATTFCCEFILIFKQNMAR